MAQLNSSLADDLMQEIMAQSPDFFERLVVQLLLKMGYGGPFEDAGIVTCSTGDGGIDGIIKEDKLGFNQIYIQAKRWAPERQVSRPEIHKFCGALQDKGRVKGLFIATCGFTEGARETASRQHIVLVDGPTLTRLMIGIRSGRLPCRASPSSVWTAISSARSKFPEKICTESSPHDPHPIRKKNKNKSQRKEDCNMFQSRTHTCGELRLGDAGKTVTLSGWMENVREVGQNFAFVVLRDFYGTTRSSLRPKR